jgi:hypothetical protein
MLCAAIVTFEVVALEQPNAFVVVVIHSESQSLILGVEHHAVYDSVSLKSVMIQLAEIYHFCCCSVGARLCGGS